MLYKKEEGRDYRRYKHTAKEQKTLRSKGLTPVVSSNVSAIARDENILYVRFHDASTYAYPKSGKLYDKMLNSKSKGKFVWDELIRKRVPYRRAGAMSFKLNNEMERLATTNLMEEAKILKNEQGLKLLAGIALSTMIDNTAAKTVDTLASLVLAKAINSNATVNAE